MSGFNCEHCGVECIDTSHGYITGCEHYPIETKKHSYRRTSFLELLQEHQVSENVVTKRVYKDIIKERVHDANYT